MHFCIFLPDFYHRFFTLLVPASCLTSVSDEYIYFYFSPSVRRLISLLAIRERICVIAIWLSCRKRSEEGKP